MEFSLEATDTMLEGADPVAGTRHKSEAPFQDRLKALYRDVGLSLDGNIELRRHTG
jgi:salicylate hydroxylase